MRTSKIVIRAATLALGIVCAVFASPEKRGAVIASTIVVGLMLAMSVRVAAAQVITADMDRAETEAKRKAR